MFSASSASWQTRREPKRWTRSSPIADANSSVVHLRWSAFAQTSVTCCSETPASASSASTASIARRRTGPNDDTVRSSNAIKTLALDETESRMRGSPRGSSIAVLTSFAWSAAGVTAGLPFSLLRLGPLPPTIRVRSGSSTITVPSPYGSACSTMADLRSP